MKHSEWYLYIKALLLKNVPLFGIYIRNRGGVTQQEYDWLRCEDEDIKYPQHLFNCADSYLMYPKSEQVFYDALEILVKAIAMLAFCPGGIRIFELHFDAAQLSFMGTDNAS